MVERSGQTPKRVKQLRAKCRQTPHPGATFQPPSFPSTPPSFSSPLPLLPLPHCTKDLDSLSGEGEERGGGGRAERRAAAEGKRPRLWATEKAMWRAEGWERSEESEEGWQ
ncbi:unnamed protein product [Closterium sp. Naga37s-1]|nr:unnamed protein product [Closterium sp. Naga37s-1]